MPLPLLMPGVLGLNGLLGILMTISGLNNVASAAMILPAAFMMADEPQSKKRKNWQRPKCTECQGPTRAHNSKYHHTPALSCPSH